MEISKSELEARPVCRALESDHYREVVRPFFSVSERGIIGRMLAYGGATYGSLAAMLALKGGGWFVLCVLVFGFGLIGALGFFHMAVHLRKSHPLIESTYNWLFGYFFSFPSYFSYKHTSRHHNRRYFATDSDTRYLPLVLYRNNFVAFVSLCVVTPLSEMLVMLVRFVVSTLYLVTRLGVLRKILHAVRSMDGFSFRLKLSDVSEAGGSPAIRGDMVTVLMQWGMIIAVALGVVPITLIGFYLGGMVWFHFFLLVQTTVEHRFEHYTEAGRREMTAGDFRVMELADSQTIEQVGVWRWPRMLIVGDASCYHALHHWFPQIPDANLHRAHIALLSELPSSHPYRASIASGFFAAFIEFIRGKRFSSSA